MAYAISKLIGKIGLATFTEPLVYLTAIQPSEMTTLNIIVEVDAVSGGVGVGTPGTILLEHSWNGGATWSTVPGIISEPITAAPGSYRAYPSSSTGLVGPTLRVTVAAPVGESMVVGEISRTHIGPRDMVAFQPPSIAGGVATEATSQAILAAVDGVEGLLTSIDADTGALALSSAAIETNTDTLVADTALIKADVAATKANTDTLVADTALIKADVAATKANTDTLVADTALIKADVADLVLSSAAIETNTDTLVADTALIKADIGTLVISNAAVEVATEAINTKTPALGQALAAASVPVVLPSDMPALDVKAKRAVANAAVVRSYASASISDAAWTEIVTSTAAAITLLKIFDSSGQIIKVATGVALSEVDLLRIPPGGDNFEIQIPAGTRISIKAETGVGTVSVGSLVFQMFT
jgi:hypothetical protein